MTGFGYADPTPDSFPVIEFEDMPEYEDYLAENSPEPPEKRILDNNGREMSFVGVYEIFRSYGGPEEGDWWYDSGELLEQFVCADDELMEFVHDLKDKFPKKKPGDRDYYCNVNYCGGDYRIEWNKNPLPTHFPEERPRYA